MDGTLVIEGPVLRGGRITTGVVEIVGGRIAPPGAASRRRRMRLPEGWIVSPGFTDLQVNGLAGAEVGDDPDALAHIALHLPRHGVTAFCPTLVTRGMSGYRAAARAIGRAPWPAHGARSLGPHLEGPFLAPARAGAHRPALMRDPSPDAVRALAALLRPAIVTLAPELPGALDAVRHLAAAGVLVAVGHTDAPAACARAAIDAGARMLTHCLNAMPGMTAREPGPAGVFLAHPAAHVGVIADGVHLAPELLALVASAAGRRLVAVSDAVAPAGAAPGEYALGGRRVRSDGREVRDRAGRLAGSAATLATAPATLLEAGMPRSAAVGAAALAPRRALGLDDPFAAGAPADLVLLDRDLAVWRDPLAPDQLP